MPAMEVAAKEAQTVSVVEGQAEVAAARLEAHHLPMKDLLMELDAEAPETS